jgi:hypothetical protein
MDFKKKLSDLDSKQVYLKRKQEIKRDNKIKRSGFLLYLLSFLGLVATTSLSLAGGYKFYIQDSFKLRAFFASIIFIELMFFVVSTYETTIEKRFNKHYITVKSLQLGLLIVSIYYNYNFFASDNLITFLMCILLDLGVIKFVSLAYDQRTLNYTFKANISDDLSLLQLLFFVITAKPKIKLLRKYNFYSQQLLKIKQAYENNSFEPLIERDMSDLENKSADKMRVVKNENNKISVIEKDTKELINVIFDNQKDFVCPSITFLTENTSLSRPQVNRVKSKLAELGILTTRGTETTINLDTKDEAIRVIKEGGIAYAM